VANPEEESMDEPVQAPLDPEAVCNDMRGMQADADRIIARAVHGRTRGGMALRMVALDVFRVMRPHFGPANAWLFNERQLKLRQLARALGPEADELLRTIDETFYERACAQLEELVGIVRELGFHTRVEPSDRAALSWTPAEGFAVTIEDPRRRVPSPPPHAGTSAGADVPPTLRSPTLLLHVFPPRPGEAAADPAAREQPGRFLFSSGGLVAFTSAEPRAQEVQPDLIERSLLDELLARGFLPQASPEAVRQIEAWIGQPPGSGGPERSAIAHHGAVWVVAGEAPAPGTRLPAGGPCVHWAVRRGSTERACLLVP
jgi:hypothetical protein